MYDPQKRTFSVKKFELKSIALVQRAYRTEYICSKASSGNTIKGMVKRLETMGLTNSSDKRARQTRVVTEELVKSIKNLIIEDPAISLRKSSNLVSASYETVRFVLRKKLNMKPYKEKKFF